MGYFIDGVRALGVTLKNVFRKPVTVQFPEVIRPRPERYRASFALPLDEHGDLNCVGCPSCEKICPSGVINVKAGPKRESPITGKKRSYPDEFTLDLSACIFCELCVQVCNSEAIVMLHQPEQPEFSREDLVLTLDKLIANGKDKPHSWATGEKLMAMQEVPKEKVVKPAPAVAPAPVVAAAPAPVPAPAPVAASEAPPVVGAVGEKA